MAGKSVEDKIKRVLLRRSRKLSDALVQKSETGELRGVYTEVRTLALELIGARSGAQDRIMSLQELLAHERHPSMNASIPKKLKALIKQLKQVQDLTDTAEDVSVISKYSEEMKQLALQLIQGSKGKGDYSFLEDDLHLRSSANMLRISALTSLKAVSEYEKASTGGSATAYGALLSHQDEFGLPLAWIINDFERRLDEVGK